MDTRKLRLHRIIALAIAAGVLLFTVMAISVQTTLAVDNDEDKDGDYIYRRKTRACYKKLHR